MLSGVLFMSRADPRMKRLNRPGLQLYRCSRTGDRRSCLLVLDESPPHTMIASLISWYLLPAATAVVDSAFVTCTAKGSYL